MSDPHFDDALLKHVPKDLHAEYRRTQPEPKRRKPPDLDPRPPSERENAPRADGRRLVSDQGVRVYSQAPSVEQLMQQLGQAHSAWEFSGSPEDGPAAELLVSRLADAYMYAAPGSEEESMLASYASEVGLEEVIDEVATVYNRLQTKGAYRSEGIEKVEQMWSKDPQADQMLRESYIGDSEFMEQVLEGEVPLEAIEADLAVRRSVAEEIVSSDRRRTQLEAEDAELLRHGPRDDAGMEAYRAELEAATEAEVAPSEESVERRRRMILGEQPPDRRAAEDAAEMAELRRMGAIVDPVEDERRQRWAREAQEHVDANK